MIYYITNQTSIEEMFSKATIEDVITFITDGDREYEVDTETTGLSCHTDSILTLQIGNFNTQFVIDCTTVDISPLKEYFENPIYTWVLQNAKFDLQFLYKKGIVLNQIYDTFLVEVLLNKGKGWEIKKGLDALCSRYLEVHLDKSIRSDINRYGLSKEVIEYAAKDVMYLKKIKKLQMIEVKKYSLERDIQMENAFVKALAYLEFSGVYLNQAAWKCKIESELDQVNALKQSLDTLTMTEFPEFVNKQYSLFDEDKKCTLNWNSSKQLIPLFKKLGVDTKVKDKDTGKFKDSVDVKLLKSYKGTHDIIDTFIKFSNLNKRVSTFGESVLNTVNPITRRIHTNYRQVVDTGRLSSGGFGSINMQQIPNDYTRECFTVPNDNTDILVADYSGMETIMLAHYANDPEFTAYLTHPEKDLHSLFASYLFEECKGLPHPTIKKDFPHLRGKAKGGTFAFQFGGNGQTISSNLSVPIEVGDATYNGVLDTFPNLKNYWERIKKETLDQGYVLINPVTKAKRFLPEHPRYLELKDSINRDFWDNYKLHKENATEEFKSYYKPTIREFYTLKGQMERKALNTPVQGTCAAIFKTACILLFNWVLEKGYFNKVKFCVFLHDEVFIECPKELTEEASAKLQECMESASLMFSSIKMEAKPVIGTKWAH